MFKLLKRSCKHGYGLRTKPQGGSIMIVKKITVGFVVQSYDTETDKFVSQEFVAGDQVDWEDEEGGTLNDVPNAYLPFDMVQPQ